MSDIKRLTEAAIKFREERGWSKFHTSKELAIAISVEASELLEAYLWKSEEEVRIEKIEEELADVLIFCFMLADRHGLDIPEIVLSKIERNGEKYPLSTSQGRINKP
ncbi:MAG: nucleotide pyrophosphohydrolase [Bacteroidetes bacterium]|nr:nucleotide pyrophosphohydrolase [Bacteroidota bacterium]